MRRAFPPVVFASTLFVLAAASGCIDGQKENIPTLQPDAGAGADAGGASDSGPTVTTFGDSDDNSSEGDAWSGSDAAPSPDTGGSTCSGSKQLCNGTCVDTSSSDKHCGKCGKSCSGSSTCKSGTCKCSGGGTMCNGSCVDTSSSDKHCGSCGNSCSGSRSCKSGSCKCPSGESYCNGSCINTTSDPKNCGSCGNSCGSNQICSQGSCGPNQKVANVISETNKVRSTQTDCGQYGVLSKAPPLSGNANLHQAAQKHADDMAMNDFFDHTGSDGSNFAQRASNAGFTGRPIGENIAAGNSTAAATVQQWEGSDGHCRNMMNSSANVIGVGVARGGSYGWYWVQVFGRK